MLVLAPMPVIELKVTIGHKTELKAFGFLVHSKTEATFPA
jgi:hypothetical protein